MPAVLDKRGGLWQGRGDVLNTRKVSRKLKLRGEKLSIYQRPPAKKVKRKNLIECDLNELKRKIKLELNKQTQGSGYLSKDF